MVEILANAHIFKSIYFINKIKELSTK